MNTAIQKSAKVVQGKMIYLIFKMKNLLNCSLNIFDCWNKQ